MDIYCRHGYALAVASVIREHGWTPMIRQTWSGNHDRIPPAQERGDGDLVLSCHWPRLFTDSFLGAHQYGGINLHPNLSLGYKVEDPVGQALRNNKRMMSVACHRMTSDPDSGEILAEHWRTIPDGSTVEYAYELLKPLYSSVLKEALSKL